MLLCIQVPVLFDKKTKTIVSNESADIIRMFATECQVRPHADSPAFQEFLMTSAQVITDGSMSHEQFEAST